MSGRQERQERGSDTEVFEELPRLGEDTLPTLKRLPVRHLENNLSLGEDICHVV